MSDVEAENLVNIFSWNTYDLMDYDKAALVKRKQ